MVKKGRKSKAKDGSRIRKAKRETGAKTFMIFDSRRTPSLSVSDAGRTLFSDFGRESDGNFTDSVH